MNRTMLKYPLLLLWFSIQGMLAQSVGGTTSGAASYCSSSNSGFISVSGYTGSILFWESSVNGGPWTNIGNVTPNQSYVNLTQNTCYRAVVKNGTFPADTSTASCITIYAPTVSGTISAGGTFCGGTGPGSLTISGNTGNVLYWLYSTDGGITWSNIANTTTTLTYTNITANTIYEAVVQNTTFCATDTTSQSSFTIDPVSSAGIIISSANDSVCTGNNGGTLTLGSSTGQVTGWLSSTNGGVTWSPITNTTSSQSFSNLSQSTLYEAIVQSGICPADTSNSISVTVVALPLANAGPDSTITSGQSITLSGSGTGIPSWIPAATLSTSSSFTPVATPIATTSYILTTMNSFGCMNSDTVVITIKLPVFNGIIANYFTPNGDGINDAWYIQDIQSYADNEVSIYNIYGNEVYSKKGYTNDWKGTYNGSELPDGTYYYVVKFDNQDKVYKGSVDIIRKK
jgi:gliding motility-associated-like protein